MTIPVEKEGIVIESIKNIEDIDNFNTTFSEGEIARIEIYQEDINIEKKAFVCEEINIRKEVRKETIEASKIIRREELEIKAEGNIIQQ